MIINTLQKTLAGGKTSLLMDRQKKLMRMSVSTRTICTYSAISTNDIDHRTSKQIPKFIWKHKRSQVAKANLGAENSAGGIPVRSQIIFPNQTYLGRGTQTEDQWVRIEDPETNPHSYSCASFPQSCPKHMLQESFFNKTWWGKWYPSGTHMSEFIAAPFTVATGGTSLDVPWQVNE